MASNGDYKKHGPRLFGVDLTQRYTNASHDDRTQKAILGGETRANKKSHSDVPELKGSASKSRSSAQGSMGSVFPCRYCSKKFCDSKALGGHQNAHRIEHRRNKTNLSQNSLPTHSFQYPIVGQQPTPALFASNNRLPHNFELQRVDVSNNQLRFGQFAQNFHVNSASSYLSSVKRARNDTELASRCLPSVERAETRNPREKRARNEDPEERNTTPSRMEDPEQHNTTPNRMVTLSTEDVELDLSLHL